MQGEVIIIQIYNLHPLLKILIEKEAVKAGPFTAKI